MKQQQKGKKKTKRNKPQVTQAMVQQEVQGLVRLTSATLMVVFSLLFLLFLYWYFA
jgi:hypothetical protein